jgi:acetyl/propionyl-CoA carboxylase alpha subunit
MFFDAAAAGETARIEVREARGVYRVTIGDKTLELDLVKTGAHEVSVLIDGLSYDLGLEKTDQGFAVLLRGDRFEVELKDAVKGAALGRVAHAGPTRLTAPMPGKIIKVLVSVGEAVEAGRGLVVMEAMKMENELKAPRGGTIQEIRVLEGQAVEMGAPLLVIG